jgi:hypothetical protein
MNQNSQKLFVNVESNYQYLRVKIMYSQRSCSDEGASDVKFVTSSKVTTRLTFRRNHKSTTEIVNCSFEDTFGFDTCCLFRNMLYKSAHE